MIDFNKVKEQEKVLSEVHNNIINILRLGGNPSYVKKNIINDNDNTKNIIKHFSCRKNYTTAVKLGYIYENIRNGKLYNAEIILSNKFNESLSKGKCLPIDLNYLVSIINASEAAIGLADYDMQFTKKDILVAIGQRGVGGMAGGKCENLFPLVFPGIGNYSNSKNKVDNVIDNKRAELKCPTKPGHNHAGNINTGSTTNRKKSKVIKESICLGAIEAFYDLGIHFNKKNEIEYLMKEYDIFNKKSFSLSFILRGKEINESYTLLTCNEIAVDFYKRYLIDTVSEDDFISFIREWNIKTYDKLFNLQYEEYKSAEWLLTKLYRDDYNPFRGDKEIFYSSVLKDEDIVKWTVNKKSKGNNPAVEAECCDFYSIMHYHYDFVKYAENSDFIIIGNGYLDDEDRFMLVFIPRTASITEVLKYVKILGPRTSEENSMRCDCRIMVRDEFSEKDFTSFA